MGKTTRRAFLGRAAGAGGLAVGLGLTGVLAEPGPEVRRAVAQTAADPAYGAWEQLTVDPAVGVVDVFAPSSGALLAATELNEPPIDRGLWRSDDGGRSWRPLSLPPGGEDSRTTITVDPTDHTVAYARVHGVLYRTTDDAPSWQPLTAPELAQAEVRLLPIVSRADPNLLYLITSWSRPLRILRSRDRGDSWEQIVDGDPPNVKSIEWGTRFLLPHPTDANRVYLGIGYGGVVPPPDEYRVSTDQGTTWQPSADGPTGLSGGWVGGIGAAAGSFWGTRATYGPANPNLRGVASVNSRPRVVTLERGTSDGTGWAPVSEIARTPSSAGTPTVALAADHTQADRLFLNLGTSSSTGTTYKAVHVSLDGGQSWRPAGHGGPTAVWQLIVGVDGKTLFARDVQERLWRLALT